MNFFISFGREQEEEVKISDKIIQFVKKEPIFIVATFLAVVSMFFVPVDKTYFSYIDTRVLALLFSFMIVMAGLKELGIFYEMAGFLTKKVKDFRQLTFVLVFLCFFTSMLITNDVALITFVPFTILLLHMIGLEEKMISIIVLQTIAANLGSMLTPIGNPQNLYIYGLSGMNMGNFLSIMGPLTVLSAILLVVGCMFQKKQNILTIKLEKSISLSKTEKIQFVYFVLVFLVSLLSVLRFITYWIPLGISLFGTFFLRKEILKKVDYNLLLTFLSFFIFIGNMGRMETVRNAMESLLEGREVILAFLLSQVISNVPTAILLSGFTSEWNLLLMGVNVGGLGTLIASLASLISYKFYAQEEHSKKGKYILHFTIVNVIFAIILLFAATLL